ncbi:MAG TPA: GAF domain-containing protein [Chloroflexota bacterium]|nr:GAF domain-containing protein [Chloroflexota bacterium]
MARVKDVGSTSPRPRQPIGDSVEDPRAAVDERALEDARRRAERLATLNDASRELTALRDIPGVCETIYTQVRRVLDCGVFYMGLHDPERDVVELVLTMDKGERFPNRLVPAHESLVGQVISTRMPVVRDTVAALLGASRLLTQGEGGPCSAMIVPMLIGDRVVGVISAQSYEEHAYSPDDVQMLQSLANQAAVVIENSRLYEQARGWISQLEVVQRLSMELNRLDSVTAIASSVARSIEALLPFDAYRIMLVDYAARELVPIAFGATRHEYDAQSIDSLRMPLGEGITGWSALTGEPLVVDDAGEHPLALEIAGTPKVIESMLVAPMRRDQTVLGVLTLSKLGLKQYSSEHLRLLRIFADQAATAIANAQLYESERQRVHKLRELDQLRKDFVSTVTHELRTPLTGILGFTETLLNFWDRLSPERQKEMVYKIQSSTARLNRLVHDLLVVSRVEAGSLSLALNPVDLAAQVQQAVVEITAKYREQSIVVAPQDEPVVLFADAHRVQQVLVNLIDNAVKYSPENSPITVSWRREGDHAVVRVRDQGPGIAEESRHLLFTRFGKIAQVARAGHVGTGLGLYISRQLVEAMGGEIWVETGMGEGSTFLFKLPLAQ